MANEYLNISMAKAVRVPAAVFTLGHDTKWPRHNYNSESEVGVVSCIFIIAVASC